MNISFKTLEFYPIPSPRRTDLQAHMTRKIILCSENSNTINIDNLHGKYLSEKGGIPYHYVVMRDGNIFYCRPKYWQNNFTEDSDSFINNSILILAEGLDKTAWTDAQEDSLVQLCVFLAKQDGILFENIIEFSTVIQSSPLFPSWTVFTGDLIAKMQSSDPTRVTGVNTNGVVGFGQNIKMTVPGDLVDTLRDLSILLNVPESTLESMNPYVSDGVDIMHNLQLLAVIEDSGGVSKTSKLDGKYTFGSGTQAGVIKFQYNKSLAQDGVVGPATLAAIDSYAAEYFPSQTNPFQSLYPHRTLKLGNSGGDVAWLQYWLNTFGIKTDGTETINGLPITAPASTAGIGASSTDSSTSANTAANYAKNLVLNSGALATDAKVFDIVNEQPIVKVTKSADSKYVVQSSLYAGQDRPAFYDSIKFPGYKRATLQMDWNVPGKKPVDGISSYTINFLVSPSSFSESRSNVRQINRTNGGWFVMKGGRNPINMSISGYMLDVKNFLEKHQFIWNYKRFIEDRKSSLFEYENYYSVKFICEGREYYGYIDNIQFTKSAERPFMHQYTISFVALDDRYIFSSSMALNEAKKIVPSYQYAPIKTVKLADIVYNTINR